MRFRKYSGIDPKAYLLSNPSGNIILLGTDSQEKNNLIPVKTFLLFQDRLSDQDQYDSEVTSE